MSFAKTMNTIPNAGMSLERGTVPEKSVTEGMSDKEFDRWVEQLGGRPCDEEFWRRMESKGFFPELPPTNSSQAA